jgi:hypothetical protein
MSGVMEETVVHEGCEGRSAKENEVVGFKISR